MEALWLWAEEGRVFLVDSCVAVDCNSDKRL